MKAIIFASCIDKNMEYSKKFISDKDYIVSCDGGLESVFYLGIKPDVLIGDFDSVNKDLFNKYSDIDKVTYNIDKDFSDLELAINHCENLNFKEILIFGALGGRMDHCLSNIKLLEMYTDKGMNIKLLDEINEIIFTRKNMSIHKTKKYLSLIALTKDCIVTIKGVKYELNNKQIADKATFTISNEIKDEVANLYVHSGGLLVIQSTDLS